MTAHQTMRSPCRCGCDTGYIRTKSGQDCMHCMACEKWCYNAPKTETGRADRSTQTVHAAIRPKQRSRILLRANRHCELCGRGESVLHVGHLVSVEQGIEYGLTDPEVNSDENLCAMCDECNLGLGAESVTLRFAVALIASRLSKQK